MPDEMVHLPGYSTTNIHRLTTHLITHRHMEQITLTLKMTYDSIIIEQTHSCT